MGMKLQKGKTTTKSSASEKSTNTQNKGEIHKTPLPSCSLATPLSSSQNSKQNPPLRNCVQKKLLSKCTIANDNCPAMGVNNFVPTRTQNVTKSEHKPCKETDLEATTKLNFFEDKEVDKVVASTRRGGRLQTKRLSKSPYVVVSDCQKPMPHEAKNNENNTEPSKLTTEACTKRGKTNKQTKQSKRKDKSNVQIASSTPTTVGLPNRRKVSDIDKENTKTTRKGKMGKKTVPNKDRDKLCVKKTQQDVGNSDGNVMEDHILGNILQQTSNQKEWTDDEVKRLKRYNF